MSEENKKLIQKIAGNSFPADELWINDNKFWAYELERRKVILTEGNVREGHVTFTSEVIHTIEPEEMIESLIIQKKSEGFLCFASR